MAKRTWRLVIGLVVGLGAAACGSATDDGTDESADQSQESALMNTGGGAPGGKCKVVAGPHKGGTGTYDDENSCCWDSGNQRICVDCDKGGAYPDGMCRDAKVIRPGYGRLRVPTRGMTISR